MEGKNFSNQKNALRRETKNQNNSKKVWGAFGFFFMVFRRGKIGLKNGTKKKGICE